MTTITIPKNLMKEKDLMLVSRSQYENLLRSSKSTIFNSYSKSDEVYEEQDTDEAISTYKKEKKQGKLKFFNKFESFLFADESSLSRDWLKKIEEKTWQSL